MTDTLADGTTVADVPEFPASRDGRCPFSPPPVLLEAAAEKPLSKVRIWDGSTPWLITGHAEQRAILSDLRVSMDEKRSGFPHLHASNEAEAPHRPQTIFNTDAPEHTRLRRLMTFPFTAKRVEALRTVIQKITDDLIDTMLAGPKPANLIPALALPLPSLMISELLGVPYEDHEFFERESVAAVEATQDHDGKSGNELGQYLAGLIAARMDSPGEGKGWVSELAERVKAGEVTLPEATMMGVVLLIAGHETSSNMIALGTLALLQNPDQLAIFRDSEDPKEIANAVEEMLRYLSIAHHGLRRIAIEDIEIGGEVIRAGDGIIVGNPVANWDPSVFPEPDQLDLHREARQHHAFGFGIHQCVGQQLARVELQVVYSTLFKRIPTLALATTFDQLEFKHDKLAFGVYELPVTW
jgi:cytochrome P450